MSNIQPNYRQVWNTIGKSFICQHFKENVIRKELPSKACYPPGRRGKEPLKGRQGFFLRQLVPADVQQMTASNALQREINMNTG